MKLIQIKRFDLVADGDERRWLLQNVPWGQILSGEDPEAREAVNRFQNELVLHVHIAGQVTIGLPILVKARLAAAIQNPLKPEETAEEAGMRRAWFELLNPDAMTEWERQQVEFPNPRERDFHWVGLDAKGEEQTGELRAPDRARAIQMLRNRGIYPIMCHGAPYPSKEPVATDPDAEHLY